MLLPTDPDNYYRQRDILPSDLLERLGQARFVITNYHAFMAHERGDAARLTKSILTKGEPSPFIETPDQVVRRVCRDLGGKKQIVVINDEAHHCYRRRPDADAEKLIGEERQEAAERDEEARVWLSGLEAVKNKIGVKAVYDLSATPFFLQGSGYPEGTLFPWVVSDFSLVDAIEAGIVKVPRVPVADNSMTGEQPTYHDLWIRIREGLPKKSGKTDIVSGEPKLPAELQGALHSLYDNYRLSFERWQANADATLEASHRRCLSSSAITRTSRRWCSSTSPAGRSVWPMAQRWSCRAPCHCSATRRTAPGRPGRTRSSWIRGSSSPARA